MFSGRVRGGSETLQLQQILPASRILVVEARSPPMADYRPRFAVCSLPVNFSFSRWLNGPTDYLTAFLTFAQRAFCAAAIRARASGESWRFFGADLAAILFFLSFVPVPAKIARTCRSLPISASICASMPSVSILKVYQ